MEVVMDMALGVSRIKVRAIDLKQTIQTQNGGKTSGGRMVR